MGSSSSLQTAMKAAAEDQQQILTLRQDIEANEKLVEEYAQKESATSKGIAKLRDGLGRSKKMMLGTTRKLPQKYRAPRQRLHSCNATCRRLFTSNLARKSRLETVRHQSQVRTSKSRLETVRHQHQISNQRILLPIAQMRHQKANGLQ